MSDTEPIRPSRRHRLLNMLLLLILLLLIAVLVGTFLLDRRPDFYLSASERDPGKLTLDAYDFSKKAQDFLSAIWSEQDYPLTLTQDEVNGYLAAVNDEGIWQRLPIKFESWRRMFTSNKLQNVQVRFTEGQVTVAGEATWLGFDVVLSIIGAPRVDAQGCVRLHVEAVRAGSLPLPRFLFAELLGNIHDRPIPAKSNHWRVTSVELHDGRALLQGKGGATDG